MIELIKRYGLRVIGIALIVLFAWPFAAEQRRMARLAIDDAKAITKDVYEHVADDLTERVIARLPIVGRHSFDPVADQSLCGLLFGYWAESPAQVTCKRCLAAIAKRRGK